MIDRLHADLAVALRECRSVVRSLKTGTRISDGDVEAYEGYIQRADLAIRSYDAAKGQLRGITCFCGRKANTVADIKRAGLIFGRVWTCDTHELRGASVQIDTARPVTNHHIGARVTNERSHWS
ncbi:hypothetical protein LCGC14_1611560 [marine sediment metagenome]|uniref:Uncharacterized protein n=1 Tax=marine sediment metagenome TaxID=412755 RepID=A0A0F9KNT2_9ZZZZ